MSPNLTKRIHQFGSTIVMLVLLAGVLGFYFFKYVPERRSVFNRNAFLELSQIKTAFQFRNQAYHQAIQNIFKQPIVDRTALLNFGLHREDSTFFDDDDVIGPTRFEKDGSSGRWQMLFPVYSHDTLIHTLSKNLNTIMSELVSTYRDIFDGYLLIRDAQSAGDSDQIKNNLVVLPGLLISNASVKSPDPGEKQKGRIIYHSGDFTMDYLVNTDSLMKKTDGFSLLNIHNVTVEGNPYKLFLYPFEMGSQRLILAGLISDSNYGETSHRIPFNYFALFTVLLLLLVIHLPILRIYILGPDERIRDTDIRLIIGAYFIAAFFGFFLFSKIFLDKEQSVQNEKNLKILSGKIIHNLYEELDSISRQLIFFDHTLGKLCQNNDTAHLKIMTQTPVDTHAIRYLDNLFKPRIYPYLNNVFWISDSGRWVARWGFKKTLTTSPLIDVKDRQYFMDFTNREALSVPGIDSLLAIQPTLSKLEGEYVITVAIRSSVQPYSAQLKKKKSCIEIEPYLIGLSSKMHSVSDVILPPGYAFSIIDESGRILYDSKTGRPLLSNILKEVEDPIAIRQTALYRNNRYFDNLLLRGKNMALLSMPVNGMPYQLLVYYNLSRSDELKGHLIGLSAGLIGVVISLVLLSALINQWSKTKTRMLESHSHHFEWLHPSANPLKQKYYHHLFNWMLILMAVYLSTWIVIEALVPRSEFSLLFISLLFPFYIALHYYELRERYYDVQENRTGINWYFSRPSLELRAMLLIMIIIINCFVSFDRITCSLAIPVLSIQIGWGILIIYSSYRFRRYMEEANIPDNSNNENTNVKNGNSSSPYKIPKAYIWAILAGVILISIIPASGIFWMFFRQEKGLYLNADQLTMGRQIDKRRQEINYCLKDYKFDTANPLDLAYIRDRKLLYGIYTISDQPLSNNYGTSYDLPHYPSPGYLHLHSQFFPTDSLILTRIGTEDSAADGGWYFAKDDSGKNEPSQALIYRNTKDNINPTGFRLTADSSASWNIFGLVVHSFSGTGPGFPVFFIVGLCFSLAIAFFLTLSLTRRIFLTELQQVVSQVNNKNILATDLYDDQQEVRWKIKFLIFETYHQLRILSPDAPNKYLLFSPPGFPSIRDIDNFEKKLPVSMLEAKMPELIKILEPVYQPLWRKLSQRQKFILFDFAQDGFANYKAGKDLQALMKKGLLFFDDLRLSMMTLSFQEYVLQKKEDPDINIYLDKTNKSDTWKKFKSPLLFILTAAGIFIFVTQDAIYQKITGLLTTLTSLLPLLNNLFTKPAGKASEG